MPRATRSLRAQHASPRSKAYTLSLSWASHLMDLVSYGLRRLPPARRYSASDAITWTVARLMPARRRLVERNFAQMLGVQFDHPRARQLAEASFRNYGRMAVDFLIVRTMMNEEIWSWVRPGGEETFKELLKEGRGEIFALAHAGSWDVAAAFALAYGLRLTIVTESNWGTQLVAGSRLERGLYLAPRDRGLRQVFRALGRNEMVAIMSDIVPEGVQSVEVPFFGRPARFPLGAARVAYRTGSPILVVSSFRMPDHSYVVAAERPVRVDRSLPEDEALRKATAEIVREFENLIRKYPDQWYPFGRIWA